MSFADTLIRLRQAGEGHRGRSERCSVRESDLRELLHHFDRLDTEVRNHTVTDPQLGKVDATAAYHSLSGRHRVLIEQRDELSVALNDINSTIYAKGAPLGSDEYFKVRKIVVEGLAKRGKQLS
jgi:hypothetical protein